MNDNINIAEILKDCPKGMELDCLMYDNVTLDCVDIDCIYPIRITTKSGFSTRLTKYGQNVDNKDAKCVLYPKGKTTWDGFVPPCEFKDGEILSNGICICIYNGNESGKCYGFYVAVGHIDFPNYFINRPQNSYFTKENSRLATEEEKEKLFQAIKDNGYRWNADTKTLEKFTEPKFNEGDIVYTKGGSLAIIGWNTNSYFYPLCRLLSGVLLTDSILVEPERFATEEEKQKLFQAIKDNGYRWNNETKTLEKLDEPKFKVGDKIQQKNQPGACLVSEVRENHYLLDEKDITLPFFAQDDWELAPDKFDITTLVPFESRVLVRDSDMGIWVPDFFGCLCSNDDCPYMVVGGIRWKCCIPFEGNQHLLGTTNNCDEYYKTWNDETNE